MLAAVMDGFGRPLHIKRVPRPAAGKGQILIRLETSGVCHSDVHVWKGDMRPAIGPSPFILGHEGVGIVAELGEGVTDWSVGDRAGAAWLHKTCCQCSECREGEESFCQSQTAHGFNVPGTFAEYVVADSRFAARLPKGDAPALAPLLCAGLTAYGAIQRADLKAGEVCAIFGCGGLGLYAVQLAARLGARVIAVDRDEKKLALASALGAQIAINASVISAAAWELEARAHVCINFAPTPATWDMMLAAIRPRGRIVAAAMVPQMVRLSQEWLASTGVRILGSSVGTRTQMAELMAMHAKHPLTCEITRIPLDEVSSALAALDRGMAAGRYCVVF